MAALVVDPSVGLKWALDEPDSGLADALVRIEHELHVPDFWLNAATNVLWLKAEADHTRRSARGARPASRPH